MTMPAIFPESDVESGKSTTTTGKTLKEDQRRLITLSVEYTGHNQEDC